MIILLFINTFHILVLSEPYGALYHLEVKERMEKIKCDRCGYIYEMEESRNARNQVLLVDENKLSTWRLCPRCIGKMTSWLNNDRYVNTRNVYNRHDRNGNRYYSDNRGSSHPWYSGRDDISTEGPINRWPTDLMSKEDREEEE